MMRTRVKRKTSRRKNAQLAQPPTFFSGKGGTADQLDVKTLEGWLWDAACSIRGAVDAPKFKDYIIPLIFVKRLSDVFEDEVKRVAAQFGDEDTAKEIIGKDHSLVRFYIPPRSIWREIRKLTTRIGEGITEALRRIAKDNPSLQGVIDIVDFNATVSGGCPGESQTAT